MRSHRRQSDDLRCPKVWCPKIDQLWHKYSIRKFFKYRICNFFLIRQRIYVYGNRVLYTVYGWARSDVWMYVYVTKHDPWKSTKWRQQMEGFSALLAICEGNSPVSVRFLTQRPVTRSLDVFFDLRLNKRLGNNRDASDLRRHRAHYGVTIMWSPGDVYSHKCNICLHVYNIHMTPKLCITHVFSGVCPEVSDQHCVLSHFVSWDFRT